MIYVLVFIIVFFLVHYARIFGGKCGVVLFTLSGGFLVLLGALRAETVGIDILVYLKRYFITAQEAKTLFMLLKSSNGEPMFMILTYVVERIFHNIQFLYFVNELLIVGFVYLAIWKMRDKIYIEVAVSFFLLIFYGQTYNTIRQAIAMAIILYAFADFLNGKHKRFYLFWILAIGFHYSAVVAISIPVMYMLCKVEIVKKAKSFFCVLMIFLITFYDSIFKFCVPLIPFIPKRYIEDKYLYREFNFPLSEAGLWGTIFLISIIYLWRKKEDADFWFYIQGLCVAGAMITAQALFVNRIFWYFEYLNIIFCSKRDLSPTEDRRLYMLIFYGGLACIGILYFYVMNVYLNNAGIFPYVFFWEQ